MYYYINTLLCTNILTPYQDSLDIKILTPSISFPVPPSVPCRQWHHCISHLGGTVDHPDTSDTSVCLSGAHSDLSHNTTPELVGGRILEQSENLAAELEIRWQPDTCSWIYRKYTITQYVCKQL